MTIFCTYCGKSFTRKEHLERHLPTHKNLICNRRFARRSSKAVLRAQAAHGGTPGNTSTTVLQQGGLGQASHTQPILGLNTAFMNASQSPVKAEGHASPTAIEVALPGGTLIEGSPQHGSPSDVHMSPPGFSSPGTRLDGPFDDFMQMGSDFVIHEEPYQDIFLWSGIMSAADVEKALHSIELAQTAQVDKSIAEFEVVKVAEGFWNLARCNPTPITGSCPRTAIVHLECLEQKSKQEGTWSKLEQEMERADWDPSHLASVVPLTSRTRDRMLAITQSFLHKALEVHRGGVNSYNRGGYSTPPGDCNFIVLPPAKVLEYFLRSYVRSLSAYYPLVTAGCVDPNEMLQNNQASTLLVLLMIAQGAAAMPRAEAQKDVELSGDPTTLRCALLFIVLGVWSGDKWLMDIAVGQRGMYMSMLKNAGMLEPQTPTIPMFNDSTNAELQWRTWVHRETRNRLVYNYVMLDQELSLFYDTAPLFAITDLRCPLPGPEELWTSPTSDHWVAAMQAMYGSSNVNPQLLSSPSNNPSLHDLFQQFLRGDLTLLTTHRPNNNNHNPTTTSPHYNINNTKSPTLDRLHEVKALLTKWHALTLAHNHPSSPITHSNLILYHLIHLNALSNFPEIERLARREGFDHHPGPWELPLRQQMCFFSSRGHSSSNEAVVHAGQALKLLREMPREGRPAWWPAAVYRVVMVLGL
ncbi:hypothetical protein N0V88_000888 [Collariella sp. IMI 366227]|nr:hypothetical protein N0V88_000888 [Collariella sp. IMI 366227]